MELDLTTPFSSTNPIVFFDITIGYEYAGRIIIELRKDVVPKTAENFRALCTGECGIGTLGKPLHYKGIRFHQIRRLFVSSSGDVVNNDGTGGESIYGPLFEDENFHLSHDEGVISMANYGKPNTNNSQFVITSTNCENLNGTNVVVGRILRGFGIIGEMEQHTTDDGDPTKEIKIQNCGEIPYGEDWGFTDNDESKESLPHFPQDWDKRVSDLTVIEIFKFLDKIRDAGNFFFKLEQYYDARRKYRKANRYYHFVRKQFEIKQQNHCDELKKLDNYGVIIQTNAAAVELKLKNYENARDACTDAIDLDPQCYKAFYRRGQANIGLQNYEEAIIDLNEACVFNPNNKLILAECKRATVLLAAYNQKQKKALKKLFQ